jgi:hypothetical protein
MLGQRKFSFSRQNFDYPSLYPAAGIFWDSRMELLASSQLTPEALGPVAAGWSEEECEQTIRNYCAGRTAGNLLNALRCVLAVSEGRKLDIVVLCMVDAMHEGHIPQGMTSAVIDLLAIYLRQCQQGTWLLLVDVCISLIKKKYGSCSLDGCLQLLPLILQLIQKQPVVKYSEDDGSESAISGELYVFRVIDRFIRLKWHSSLVPTLLKAACELPLSPAQITGLLFKIERKLEDPQVLLTSCSLSLLRLPCHESLAPSSSTGQGSASSEAVTISIRVLRLLARALVREGGVTGSAPSATTPPQQLHTILHQALSAAATTSSPGGTYVHALVLWLKHDDEAVQYPLAIALWLAFAATPHGWNPSLQIAQTLLQAHPSSYHPQHHHHLPNPDPDPSEMMKMLATAPPLRIRHLQQSCQVAFECGESAVARGALLLAAQGLKTPLPKEGCWLVTPLSLPAPCAPPSTTLAQHWLQLSAALYPSLHGQLLELLFSLVLSGNATPHQSATPHPYPSPIDQALHQLQHLPRRQLSHAGTEGQSRNSGGSGRSDDGDSLWSNAWRLKLKELLPYALQYPQRMTAFLWREAACPQSSMRDAAALLLRKGLSHKEEQMRLAAMSGCLICYEGSLAQGDAHGTAEWISYCRRGLHLDASLRLALYHRWQQFSLEQYHQLQLQRSGEKTSIPEREGVMGAIYDRLLLLHGHLRPFMRDPLIPWNVSAAVHHHVGAETWLEPLSECVLTVMTHLWVMQQSVHAQQQQHMLQQKFPFLSSIREECQRAMQQLVMGSPDGGPWGYDKQLALPAADERDSERERSIPSQMAHQWWKLTAVGILWMLTEGMQEVSHGALSLTEKDALCLCALWKWYEQWRSLCETRQRKSGSAASSTPPMLLPATPLLTRAVTNLLRYCLTPLYPARDGQEACDVQRQVSTSHGLLHLAIQSLQSVSSPLSASADVTEEATLLTVMVQLATHMTSTTDVNDKEKKDRKQCRLLLWRGVVGRLQQQVTGTFAQQWLHPSTSNIAEKNENDRLRILLSAIWEESSWEGIVARQSAFILQCLQDSEQSLAEVAVRLLWLCMASCPTAGVKEQISSWAREVCGTFTLSGALLRLVLPLTQSERPLDSSSWIGEESPTSPSAVVWDGVTWALRDLWGPTTEEGGEGGATQPSSQPMPAWTLQLSRSAGVAVATVLLQEIDTSLLDWKAKSQRVEKMKMVHLWDDVALPESETVPVILGELCEHLQAIMRPLVQLCGTACASTVHEQVLRLMMRWLKQLVVLIKWQPSLELHAPLPHFQQLIFAYSSSGLPALFSLLAYVQAEREGATEDHVPVNKLLRESRLIPSVVFAIELCQKELLKVAKTYDRAHSQQFLSTLRRSTARDFRIDGKEISKILEMEGGDSSTNRVKRRKV